MADADCSSELRRDLKGSSVSEGRRHGSNSTTYTAESDWESPLEGGVDSLTCSYNPWSLFLAFRSAKILTVEPVLFFFMLATYLYFPLYQQYFLNTYAVKVLENTTYPYDNETRCISRDEVTNYTHDNSTYNSKVQSKTSLLFIYVSLANRIPSIVMTLILGPLSDRYGRRFVMVTVALGGILRGIVAMLIVHFKLNVLFFVLSAALAGFGGDFPAILTSSFSYVTDISQGKWKTVRIGLAESMIFVGGLLAQGLGGLWFQELDCNFIPPLFLFISCHAAIILYTLIFLPPSLTPEERKRNLVGKRRGLQRLTRGLGLFFCAVREYSVWKLWFAIIPVIILVMNAAGSTSIAVFFFRYLGWSPSRIGAFQAVSMGSNAFFLIVGLPILVFLKLPDPLISLIAIFVNCATQVGMGLFTKAYLLFVVAVIQGVGAAIYPPLRSYMSKVVSAEDQGALFSVVASSESVASLASIGYSYLLPVTIGRHLAPGTAYLIMATLGLIPIPFVSSLLIHWCATSGCGRGQRLSKPLDGAVTEKAPLIQDQSPQSGTPWEFSDSAAPVHRTIHTGGTLPPPPYTYKD